MDLPDLSELGLPEKELRILEASIKIFAEKGFSAATTSEIAKSAGVAEGTIFRYFKTKKDILRGILIQTIHLMSEKLVLENIEKILSASDTKDLKTILKEILHDRMKLVDSVFPMARVILTEAMFHEDVRKAVFENIIAKAIEMFGDFHVKMASRGLIRDDIDTQIFLRCLMGNIAFFIIQKRLFGDVLPIEDSEKEFDKMIDIILHGIAK